MGNSKPLTEKTDYYSMKRMATQDVITWMEQDVPANAIMLKIQVKYGFGKKFYFDVKALVDEC